MRIAKIVQITTNLSRTHGTAWVASQPNVVASRKRQQLLVCKSPCYLENLQNFCGGVSLDVSCDQLLCGLSFKVNLQRRRSGLNTQ
eukprot:SAG31_NODE_2388_length_5808_cov_2.772640_6_plen_86_part_00